MNRLYSFFKAFCEKTSHILTPLFFSFFDATFFKSGKSGKNEEFEKMEIR
jgi:hypothetical protein